MSFINVSSFHVDLRPAKKKGYGNFLGNDTGPGTVDIMGDALSQAKFASDGADVDPDNEMDGFGALTGAIDQLAFTHDLDFSGDGVDDDPLKMQPQTGMKGPGKPTGNSLAPPTTKPEKKKKKKRDMDGHNNPAFLDDEELLLAAALGNEGGGGGGGGESDDSDTDMLEARRLARPRIVIRAETEAAATGSVGVPVPTASAKGVAPTKAPGVTAVKDPKKTPTTPVPDLGRPRLPSAKIRRIGSARKTPARFTMTFTEKYDVVTPSPGVPKKQTSAEGLSATPSSAADKGRKESNDKTKDKAREKPKDDKGKVVEEETLPAEDQEESGDKWAEKKPRRSNNKVAPSDAPEPSGDSRARDDLSVGLESGADSTREEVRAKERDRPKTSVAASQKMKRRATEDVGNMNSILPWDNEDGDIK